MPELKHELVFRIKVPGAFFQAADNPKPNIRIPKFNLSLSDPDGHAWLQLALF